MINKSDAEWFDTNGNFDWDGYEATCPSVIRKGNPHIKTKDPKHKVFCRESYAQELYDKYNKHYEDNYTLAKVEHGVQYTGTVYSTKDNTSTVDIGYRQLVFINLQKEDPIFRELGKVIGSEVDVTITSDPFDDSVSLYGSLTEGARKKTFTEMQAAIETQDTAWSGNVTKMMQEAGYIVRVNGIDCFMPGSLAGINKLHDFSSIIDTDMYVVPVSFSKEKGTIVVSHRAYLKTMIPGTIDKLKENLTQEITGTVTGSAKYGVFCEFNECLTGMIHVNDLDSDLLVRHKNREVIPGEEITFRIKDIISNDKITLTQKDEVTANPWLKINEKFKPNSEVLATVKSCKDYGLFIEIEEGIVGLLHVSEFENTEALKSYKPKHRINVTITRIEEDTKKVFLKLAE
jgi:small subunit ribosomal protein S1